MKEPGIKALLDLNIILLFNYLLRVFLQFSQKLLPSNENVFFESQAGIAGAFSLKEILQINYDYSPHENLESSMK